MDPGSPDVSVRATESPGRGKEGPKGEGQQPRSDRWHWVLGALRGVGMWSLLCTPKPSVLGLDFGRPVRRLGQGDNRISGPSPMG